MNERKATQAGYTFTGIYKRDKEEVKKQAAELRAKGNKAVVVTERDSPLSRGSRGTGYSVYWIESEANSALRKAEDRQKRLDRMIRDRNSLLQKIADLDLEISKISNS